MLKYFLQLEQEWDEEVTRRSTGRPVLQSPRSCKVRWSEVGREARWPHRGQGVCLWFRLYHPRWGTGRSLTSTMPSVESGTYSPGPNIVGSLGKKWLGPVV